LAGDHPSESVKVRHSPFASENLTVTWKWCNIGGKLVLITNRGGEKEGKGRGGGPVLLESFPRPWFCCSDRKSKLRHIKRVKARNLIRSVTKLIFFNTGTII